VCICWLKNFEYLITSQLLKNSCSPNCHFLRHFLTVLVWGCRSTVFERSCLLGCHATWLCMCDVSKGYIFFHLRVKKGPLIICTWNINTLPSSKCWEEFKQKHSIISYKIDILLLPCFKKSICHLSCILSQISSGRKAPKCPTKHPVFAKPHSLCLPQYDRLCFTCIQHSTKSTFFMWPI
jgi:hypothetical protein